jgi:hypothetical protein
VSDLLFALADKITIVDITPMPRATIASFAELRVILRLHQSRQQGIPIRQNENHYAKGSIGDKAGQIFSRCAQEAASDGQKAFEKGTPYRKFISSFSCKVIPSCSTNYQWTWSIRYLATESN